jgi:outer membrane immunogenic protein
MPKGETQMKTVIVGFASTVVIGLGLASPASAADLSRRPPAASPATTYDWSGMYLGGVLGGGWEKTDTNNGVGTNFLFPGANPPQMFQTTSSSGFIGGLEGGSNYQFGKLVVGWEGDILWGDIKGSSTTGFTGFAGPTTAQLTVNTPWTATVASRVGIAHDRWLAYGKAGVAYEHTDFTASAAAATPVFSATGSDNRAGWMVGGGLEFAAWDAWTIKAEYDYLDFGNRSVVLNGTTFFPAAVPTLVTTLNNQRISEFKAGINWKFMPNLW